MDNSSVLSSFYQGVVLVGLMNGSKPYYFVLIVYIFLSHRNITIISLREYTI